MPTKQLMNYCSKCKKQTLHIKQTPNHILHLLLSLVTGFWVIVWILVAINTRDSNCTICGGIEKPQESKPAALKSELTMEEESKKKRKTVYILIVIIAFVIWFVVVQIQNT